MLYLCRFLRKGNYIINKPMVNFWKSLIMSHWQRQMI